MTVLMPDNQHALYDQVKDRPFKLAMCLFAIYSGVAGLFDFGASNEIFVEAVRYAGIFNVAFIVSGVVTAIGVLSSKMNVEAAGLCLVSSCLVTRVMVVLSTSGWNPAAHNLLAISVLFTASSIIRIVCIQKLHLESKNQQ